MNLYPEGMKQSFTAIAVQLLKRTKKVYNMALYTAKLIQEKQLLQVVEFKAHGLPLDVLIKDVKQRFNIPRKRLIVLENEVNHLVVGNKSVKIEVTTNLSNTKFI